jgi:predicted acyltransferase
MSQMDPTVSGAKPVRLLSLDALRGFDMIWIVGASAIVRQLATWQQTPWLQAWATQLSHVTWDGLRAYDLIFPLFMFLSGVAIPFSIGGDREQDGSHAKMVRKILVRTITLVVLGMIYNGLLSSQTGTPRLLSVLGQIGIAWGISAYLQMACPAIGKRVVIVCGIIVGITALQLGFPVPGHGAGVLTETGAVNAWLDRLLVPGRLNGTTFDPEGLLCILSATSVTLAGAVVGSFLRNTPTYSWKLCAGIALTGVAVIALGTLSWKLGYPPIKSLWTGTFDLLVIGISLLIFALFFGIIDVARWQSWSLPLRIVGMNSLTIYLLTRFFDFSKPADLWFGRLAHSLGDAKGTVLAIAILLIEWLLLAFLYRKRIFLRV